MATDALPDGTRPGQVALVANDRDRLTDFYVTVVGLDVLRAGDDRTTLGAGGTPLLDLIGDPSAPERGPDEAGLFHTAFLVPSRAALGGALAQIEGEWTLDGASDHLVSEALYLTDPEGNGIEVYRDRPRERWDVDDDGRVDIDTLPLDLGAIRAAADDAGSETGNGVPDGTRVGHVHLEVASLSAVRPFYVDALGLGVQATYGDSALFVAAGGYHHHVGLNVWNGRSAPAGEGRGLAWFELTVPTDDGLRAARERLEATDYAVVERPDGVEATDPDGIALRLRSRA